MDHTKLYSRLLLVVIVVVLNTMTKETNAASSSNRSSNNEIMLSYIVDVSPKNASIKNERTLTQDSQISSQYFIDRVPMAVTVSKKIKGMYTIFVWMSDFILNSNETPNLTGYYLCALYKNVNFQDVERRFDLDLDFGDKTYYRVMYPDDSKFAFSRNNTIVVTVQVYKQGAKISKKEDITTYLQQYGYKGDDGNILVGVFKNIIVPQPINTLKLTSTKYEMSFKLEKSKTALV